MISFGNASIRTKLAAGFGAAFALIVLVGIFGHVQLRAVHHVTHEIVDVWVPRTHLLGEIKRSITELRVLTPRQMQTTDLSRRAEIAMSMDATMKALRTSESAYQRSINSVGKRAVLSEFQTLWSDYQKALRIALQRPAGGELTAGIEEFNTVLGAFDIVVAKLDDLIAFSNRKSEIAEAHAHHFYELALIWTIAAVFLAAIILGAAILWVSRNISLPILEVSDAMSRLTAGDDSVVIAKSAERKDEIGVLVAAVAGYRDSLVLSRRLAGVAELERGRLDAAVSNMPIGLSMFDAAERLVICNDRFAEIYDLSCEVTKPGTLLREIVDYRVRSGNFEGSDPEKYIADLFGNSERNEPTWRLIELNSGHILSIIHQPMEDGGWVVTHEDVTERRRAEERIQHMARHDTLTDLPNRASFSETIEEALKSVGRGEKLAVLYLDLDRFKSVNDTLGHPIGDTLLKSVAERLRNCVREVDTVSRLGGDEFAIIQVGVEQPGGTTSLAQRVIEELSVPYIIGGYHVAIGVSVGIAVAPFDGTDAEQLLKNADLALNRAKCDGRGTYRFFEQEMDARMQARRSLELDLRKALDQGEFAVFYQPIVSVKTGDIKGFEALLRWRHPQRGMVPPAEFIPLAEEIGLIEPIGEWVLRQACRDAATWPDGISVAVNLSPVQFGSKKLLETVITALAVAKLPANLLELEITEGVLLVDHETTLVMLHQLRALGVRIAMDDFGTGYSSLSYLRSFPFDKIKIDRSFIHNISSDSSSLAIIRAVTGLSASLGITTTAEGVETDDQMDRVRSEGCTEAQGFLFSEAKPATEVAQLLASRRKTTDVAA